MCQRCQTSTRILIPTSLPSHPWQKVAADIFILKGQEYMVIVDYFSRYPEVQKLKSTTTQGIINVLKAAFARHGISETFRSDNGPQFSFQEFKTLQASTTFSTVLAAPISDPAMDKQREQYRISSKKLLTPFSHYSHIELLHSHGVEDHLQSY